MSKARKCDRCGEFFKVDGDADSKVCWVKIHCNVSQRVAYYDLCDMCYKSLMTFMEQYKAETENP